MDRETKLQTIDAAYAARQRGDLAGIVAFLAPGATYRMVGVSEEPEDAAAAIGRLIDQFQFAEMKRSGAAIDGDVVAVHVQVKASTGGGRYVESELLHWWRFDDAGKIAAIVEFADTGLIGTMLAAAPDY